MFCKDEIHNDLRMCQKHNLLHQSTQVHELACDMLTPDIVLNPFSVLTQGHVFCSSALRAAACAAKLSLVLAIFSFRSFAAEQNLI